MHALLVLHKCAMLYSSSLISVNFSCIPPWPALKAEGRQRHSEELQDKYIGLPNRLSSILLTELGELGIKATQDPKGPLWTWLLSTDYLKRISHITPRSALISLLQAYVHMDEFIPCSPWPICSQPKHLLRHVCSPAIKPLSFKETEWPVRVIFI